MQKRWGNQSSEKAGALREEDGDLTEHRLQSPTATGGYAEQTVACAPDLKKEEKADKAAGSRYPFPRRLTEILLYSEWQCTQRLVQRHLS